MSDADDLGRTRPTAPTTSQKDGATALPRLPEEPVGRFEGAVKELGRGGMGRVLEVQDVALGRPVAIKELLDPSLSSARFVREARLTAQLEHPGVVPVYELGQRRDGAPYYAMRKVHGGTLEDALDACATLTERLTLMPHLLDVVQTIAYAHSKGVLHRDLKPANVMVGKFGETMVLDWGLARPKSEVEAAAAPTTSPTGTPIQTQEGASVGTPTYMAPEQARGERDVDERADVWSLGVMMFELLCGRAPFDGETAMQMLVQVSKETPPKVRALEPHAPKALADITDRALSTSRDQRYPSAVEMAEALEVAVAASANASQRRWFAPLALGFALGAVVLLALFGLLKGRTEEEHPVARPPPPTLNDARQGALAQAAWDEGDVASAARLAQQAPDDPLARGVLALARTAGLPEKVWLAKTAAGCAQLAVVDGRVACASFGAMEFFNAEDGTELPRLSTGPTGWQHAVVSLPNEKLLALGGDDGAVRVMRPGNPPEELQKLVGLSDGVRSLAASPDETEVAVGLRDGSVLRWKRSELLARSLFTLKGPVAALAWSRDGLLAASARDATRVVKLGPAAPQGKSEATTVVFEVDRPARGLLFAASWPLYLTAGRDVLALTPGLAANVFAGARHDLSSVILLGNRLVAASVDGAAQSWTTDGAGLGALRTFEPGRIVLAAEPARSGGAPDFYAAAGKTVQAWRWKKERFTQPPPELTGEATAFTFTPEGGWCAGLRDGRLACNQPGRVSHRHAAPVVALTVLQQKAGWLVLSAAEDGSVLLSVPGKEQAIGLSRKDHVPLAVALSPDGARAATSWDDGALVLFSIEYGKEIETVHEVNALALAFSPDSRLLAAARADKRVVAYLAESGKEQQQLEGADGRLRTIAFSADGSRLAAAGDDHRVSMWTTLDWRLSATLTGPDASIGALAFSLDGAQLAAASDDGTVRVWAGDDARPIVEVRGHFGDARAVGFAPGGALLEAGGDGVPRSLPLQHEREGP